MTRPGARALPAVLAASALLWAACAKKESARIPPAAPGAKLGGQLAIAISEPTSIDPASSADSSGDLVVSTMCDALAQIDPVTGSPRPAIAESWQISDAGRRITVKLRKSAVFQNGRHVTADDVVFSLSRVASEDTASPVASLLAPIVGFENVHGETQAKENRLHKTLQGLRVIGQHSFEIALKDPHSDFIRVLAEPLAAPVSKIDAQRDPTAFARRPVCSGPYRLAGPWQPGDTTIRLTRARYQARNEGYTRGGRGYLDQIEFRVLPDRLAEANEFVLDKVDVAHMPRLSVADAAAHGVQLTQSPSPNLEYVGLPDRTPPFDDRDVRVAMSRALDRNAIAASVFGGGATPARGFLPPTLGSVHRDAACGSAAPATPDVDGARSVLARAGVDLSGKSVKLYFNDEFDHRPFVQAVARQWEAAFGLKVDLVPMPWEQYLALGTGPSGFNGPYRMSWEGAYASADAYLAPLFSSASIGRDNFSRFSSPDFDRILARVARRATAARDQRLDYQQLEDIVCQQMPVVPVVFLKTNHLIALDRIASARSGFGDRTSGDVLVRELYRR